MPTRPALQSHIQFKTGLGTYTYQGGKPHAVTHLDGAQKYWYDNNGNMTARVENGVTYQQTFDAENRLVSVTVNGQTTSFVYDGDGARVKKTEGATYTVYVGNTYEAQYPVPPPPCDPTQNGWFDGSLYPWTGTGSWDGNAGHDEPGSAKLTSGQYVAQTITPEWTGLTLSVWAKRGASSATLRVQVIDTFSGAVYADQSFSLTTAWTGYQVAVASGATRRLCQVKLSSTTGLLWADDVGFSCAGSVAPLKVVKYYHLAGQRVAMRETVYGATDTPYWLLTDHLGSTALTVKSDGSVYGQLRYQPYGQTRYTSGTTPTARRFTGQIEESTIALYDYGARFYDPALGRFISADTVVPQPGNPQALNRFAYVLNNPLKFTDPTGHYTYEETPDDPVTTWTRRRGSTGAVRSASQSSAPFDIRGIQFAGDDWTPANRQAIYTAVDRVDTALTKRGVRTAAALGTGGGRTLIFNRIPNGYQACAWGERNTIDIEFASGTAIEDAIHEMGHIVDWHARPDGSSVQWSASGSTEWAGATGWRRWTYMGPDGNPVTSWVMWSEEGARGFPTFYARNDPLEDFADTFLWDVEDRNPGPTVFGRAWTAGRQDLKGRLIALSTALDKFR